MQMLGRRTYPLKQRALRFVLLSNILHELAAVDFLPVFDCILIQVLQFVAHISALRSPLLACLSCLESRLVDGSGLWFASVARLESVLTSLD